VSDADVIAALDRRCGIAGIAQVVRGNGSLPKVVVSTSEANGEMYLHGGHVTSWKPAGADDMLFVSEHTRWEDGRAIRGGVPVCFPWFGAKADDRKAPSHGLVRTISWQLESITHDERSATVSMFTDRAAVQGAWWPADFRLVHRVTFGAELTMELVITNSGVALQRFEEALHTYFKVGDARQVRVGGLDGVYYLDKADQDRKETQHGDITITGETDREYLDTKVPVVMTDPVLRRRIRVGKAGSSTTVVWNPWVDKAKALPDLGDDEWTKMVCIEGCNAGDAAIELPPGACHTMRISVTATPL